MNHSREPDRARAPIPLRELVLMIATAASIYTAIRVDLAELRARAEYAAMQAERANARLDGLQWSMPRAAP